MISYKGYRIHFACMGSGAKTFVLDAGATVGGFEWWRVAPLLAKKNRVCTFDRPGLGWSEQVDENHDASALADELSAFAKTAKIKEPFTYVGHSLGANIAIVYAARHPKDLAALVLIEPGDPKDLLEDFHGTPAAAMTVVECNWACYAGQAAAYLGVTRLAAILIGAGRHTLAGTALAEYRAELARPSQVAAMIETVNALPKTGYEVMSVKTLGKLPVLVLTSSNPRARESDETEQDLRKWRGRQLTYFRSIAAMSMHGVGPVIIPNSNHANMVMGEAQAPVIVRAIETFSAQANAP